MNRYDAMTTRSATDAVLVGTAGQAQALPINSQRVLRNTYALLSMTLLFSAAVAAMSAANGWGSPGLIVTLVGYFGLLFAVHKLRNSAWGIAAVFALTGFMGLTIGPIVASKLALPGGAQLVTLALGATGATFLGLSGYALASRRDFSFMGNMLFAGMIVALVGGLASAFMDIPALGLAMAGLVAMLSAGMILFETSRIVHGGEDNYLLATVSLYVSIYNLFLSLLQIFGVMGSDD